ncbi:CDP-alcohol phosphatidyltransferase family protein [bacterium]|nr:CDP-alcohol phosphatidyltransferase family protein [bacterium]
MKLKDRWMKLRNYQSDDFWAMVFARPLTILFLLPIVEKKWVTPNRITVVSILTKLAGSAFVFFDRTYSGGVIGAILLNLGLVLDNMDGTVSRFRNCPTKFGFYLDKISDAVTMTLMFWAIGFRAYIDQTYEAPFFDKRIDLILPLIAATASYVAGYAKWVSERVLLDLKIIENHRKGTLDEFGASMDRCPVWSTPPKRTFFDWLKWFLYAIFSIFKINEVDIFFFAALALITGKLWIFTWIECGILSFGIIVVPVIFAVKVIKKEREVSKIPAKQ